MPQYKCIETSIPAGWSNSALKMARWKDGTFFADFSVGPSGTILRASFMKPLVTRILGSETPIAEVEASRHIGSRRDHLVYEVINSDFWRDHVFATKEETVIVRNFRFLSRTDCVDVLSTEPPMIRVISSVDGGKA